MRKSGIVITLIVILVAAGLFFYFKPANQIKALEVELVKVEKGLLSKTISASGNIQPERKISLTSEKGDKVNEIMKKVGDKVKKDDILIKFENGYELKSPIEGMVLEVRVVEGEKMTPAVSSLLSKTSSLSPIITVADFNPLIVEAKIDEKDIVEVDKGQEVKITLDAYPNRELNGKIIEVGVNSQAGPGETPAYLTKIEIQKTEDIYPRAGLSADIKIKIKTKKDVLFVPYEAVFKEEDEYFVFKVENKIAKKTKIKVGLETEDYYEVSDGLKEGDRVIVSDLDKVVDGQKVKTR